MTYSELPTLARFAFMFIFMVTASYLLLGLSVEVLLMSINMSGWFSMFAPLFLAMVSYTKYCSANIRGFRISIFLLALLPLLSVANYVQVPKSEIGSGVILVWWPLANAVVLYACIAMLLRTNVVANK